MLESNATRLSASDGCVAQSMRLMERWVAVDGETIVINWSERANSFHSTAWFHVLS